MRHDNFLLQVPLFHCKAECDWEHWHEECLKTPLDLHPEECMRSVYGAGYSFHLLPERVNRLPQVSGLSGPEWE